jgi:four helix bundle protein
MANGHASSGAIKRFQDLIAWKLGFRIAVLAYEVTKDFPNEEKYNLTGQLRRSASSIPANIAEGFGRHTPREYLNFPYYARGSVAETESHLELAYSLGFLKQAQMDELQNLCLEARKTLQGLIRHVRSTVSEFGEGKISEEASDYLAVPSDPELSTDNSQLISL